VHAELETKRRLWTGVFTYALEDLAPAGMKSPDHCFVAVHPERALVLKNYGSAGLDVWRRR
jgi:hypothetical protein